MMPSLEAPTRQEKESNGPPLGLMLRVRGTEHDGKTVVLQARKCSIGRSASCTLRLISDEIGPVHCFIVRGSQGTIVRCWGPNTRLNGRDFQDEWFRIGDRLQVGPVELECMADPLCPANMVTERLDESGEGVEFSASTSDPPSRQDPLQPAPEHNELERDEFEREKARWSQQRREFESELLAERERLRVAWDELQKEREAASAELTALPTIDDLSQRCSLLESEVTELQEQRDLLVRELDELRRHSVDDAGRRIAELTVNQEELMRQCERLVATVEERQCQIEQLNQALTTERQRFREREAELTARAIETTGHQPGETEIGIDLPNEAAPPEMSSLLDSEELLDHQADSHVISEPDEICFSEPDSSAPTDAASVLAKYGLSFAEDGGTDGGGDSVQEAVPVSTRREQERVPHDSVTASAPCSADEVTLSEAMLQDSSIDDYMADLMQRVSSGPLCPVPPQISKVMAGKANVPPEVHPGEPEASPVDLNIASEEPRLEPEDFVPRTKRPQFDLSAMRDVANETARVAIDRHESRRCMQIMVANWGLAGISLLIGLGLSSLIRAPLSTASIGAVVALTATFNWGYRGVQAYREVLHHRRMEAAIYESKDA